MVVAGWLVAVLWLADNVLSGPPAIVVAAVTGTAIGFAVNRWWSMAVPLVVAAAISVWAIVGQTDEQEVAGVLIAAFAMVVAGALCLTLLLGVGFRRLWDKP